MERPQGLWLCKQRSNNETMAHHFEMSSWLISRLLHACEKVGYIPATIKSFFAMSFVVARLIWSSCQALASRDAAIY